MFGQGVNILYLNLLMDYIDNNHFGKIKIYENEYRFNNYNKNDSIISNPDLKTNKKGEVIISSSYKIIDDYSLCVVFELSNYNISYLKVKYEGKYENNKLKVNAYIYIYIIRFGLSYSNNYNSYMYN